MTVVLGEVRKGIGWITLNRPKKLNALAVEVVKTARALVATYEDNNDVRVIVVTGAGGNFSVGYDIAEEVASGIFRPEDWHAQLSRNVDLSMSVWSSLKPTIAAVDGWCLAGACELAMACDMIVATDRAKFGEPETLWIWAGNAAHAVYARSKKDDGVAANGRHRERPRRRAAGPHKPRGRRRSA